MRHAISTVNERVEENGYLRSQCDYSSYHRSCNVVLIRNVTVKYRVMTRGSRYMLLRKLSVTQCYKGINEIWWTKVYHTLLMGKVRVTPIKV